MADALVSALVATVLSNLNSTVLQELGVVGGLKTEHENLKRTFTMIQAVVRDAEEKQWKNEAIKQWLINLKDATYDADDVLDEFTIEAQRHLQQSDLKNRVRSFFSLAHNPLLFRVKMARRLKTVREKLDANAKERHDFHLREGVGDVEVDSFDWRVTSSYVNESKIYGRDKEKEDLIHSLLTTSNDLSVYAICGMGGIGKTTLAQLINNDDRVKRRFDLRIWVCVSNDSDFRRLTRAMIESVENSPCDIKELDPLQRRLQEKLSGKKLLLVLDDVWDDYHDKWNSLNDLLRCGAKGSVVVITTRVEIVALKMEPVLCLHMERLSDDDSWHLFERLAFGMRRREEYAHLETIGRAIVKKCGGVPLAIKALGNLMRLKKHEDEWLCVKESEIWDLRQEGSTILPALRLSYINLPPHLKQCFAYCSIFPKDYVMEKDRLITLWMANGFIACKGQMDLHGMGRDIFNELAGRSFFQDVKDDGLGNITCKLHDLIHDLAQSITSHECISIAGNKKMQMSETVRHVAFYGRSLVSAPDDKDLKARSLRSFLVTHVDDNIKPWREDLHPYFSRQKYLRALAIKVTKLPESICNLKHLRYLDVSGSFIHKLPESTISLQNLQTLILRNCTVLHMLPKDMKDMKNLKYLDITGCEELRCMPAGMGQLTCLQKLSMFIVGKHDGHNIGELNRLNFLGGELRIKNLDNIQRLTEARDANLMGKKNLQSLNLSWKREISSNASMERSEEVLCGLQPHSNLKQLCISGYQGIKFPNWMMDLLLPNLVQISVEECCRCERLPPFGKLQFLKNLRLKSVKGLKYISRDVYGDEEIPFPSLESLTLDSMQSLEAWTNTAGTGRDSFPCLREITVCNCAKLVDLPAIPSVRTLKIKNSSTASLLSVRNFSSLTSLRIEDFCDLTHLPDGMVKNHAVLGRLEIARLRNLKSLSYQLDNLFALKRLFLIECDELESLPEGLQNLNSLESLHINSCGGLKSLPINGLRGLHSLRRLHVLGCDKLASLSKGVQYLTALEHLYIYGCSQLNSLPQSIQHLTSLRSLTICDCKGISSLPNQIGHLMSLSHLRISDCPDLMSLPDGVKRLNMLNQLEIEECPNLERRCQKETGEDWLNIAHIPKIVINSEEIQSLGSWQR